jgi:hypothetical protein
MCALQSGELGALSEAVLVAVATGPASVRALEASSVLKRRGLKEVTVDRETVAVRSSLAAD